MQEDTRKREQLQFYGTALTLGLNMAVGVAVFSLIGYWFDQRHGGGRLGTLCGIFMGLSYGGYEVWKVCRDINRRAAEQEKDKQGDKSG